MPRVAIQSADFDLSHEVAALHGGDADVGAIATFTGTVRGGHAVNELELEHYPGMTEAAIDAMIDAALQRFDVHAARVIHRIGRLRVGEQIVFVGVVARHRGPAFEACEFLMDYLKTQAPFWKKEFTPDGARWVDAREADERAAERWGLSAPNR